MQKLWILDWNTWNYQTLRKLSILKTIIWNYVIGMMVWMFADGPRVKWSNPGKGVAPSPTPRCRSYRKGSPRVTLDYSCHLYLLNSLQIIISSLHVSFSHQQMQVDVHWSLNDSNFPQIWVFQPILIVSGSRWSRVLFWFSIPLKRIPIEIVTIAISITLIFHIFFFLVLWQDPSIC